MQDCARWVNKSYGGSIGKCNKAPLKGLLCLHPALRRVAVPRALCTVVPEFSTECPRNRLQLSGRSSAAGRKLRMPGVSTPCLPQPARRNVRSPSITIGAREHQSVPPSTQEVFARSWLPRVTWSGLPMNALRGGLEAGGTALAAARLTECTTTDCRWQGATCACRNDALS